MTKEEMKFWYRIEDAVIASGMNKSEIARKAGLHRQTLSYMPNRKIMSCASLKAFCEVTGASADWILGLTEEQE